MREYSEYDPNSDDGRKKAKYRKSGGLMQCGYLFTDRFCKWSFAARFSGYFVANCGAYNVSL